MNKIYPLSGFAMFFGCFTLYAQVPPPTPEICVVTTNDTINKHVIVWEKTPGDNIAFYKMFRENSLGGFDVLDTVYREGPSEYIVQDSDPQKTLPSTYEISGVDSNGVESGMSAPHTPIGLTATINQTTYAVHCSWTQYGGVTPLKLRAWEGSTLSAMHLTMDSISRSDSWWEDITLDMAADTLYYMVEAMLPSTCTVGIGKVSTKNYNSTRSNKTGIPPPPVDPLSVAEVSLDQGMRLFPNPTTTGSWSLRLLNPAYQPAAIWLVDASGRIVDVIDHPQQATHQTYPLPGDVAAGMYKVVLHTLKGPVSLSLQIR